MKIAIVIAAAGLTAFTMAATPAAAWKITPSGDFTADGTTSATKNGVTLPCKAHFTGTVNAHGIAHITSGEFTDNGGPPGACGAVQLANLPWKTAARTAKAAKIYNVQFTTPIGSCGPGAMPVRVRSGGVIVFTAVPLAGGCTVSGNLTTTPQLSIVE